MMFNGTIGRLCVCIILIALVVVFLTFNQPASLISSNDIIKYDTLKTTAIKTVNKAENKAFIFFDPKSQKNSELSKGMSRAAEKSLKRLVAKSQFDDNSQLILNAKMQTALNQFYLVSGLPLTEKQKHEISLYVFSQIPSDAAGMLVTVIDLYFSYKTKENDFLEKNTDLTRLEELHALNSLREEVLGREYSNALFFERSARTEYHLKTSQIKQDTHLTPEDKITHLKNLKESALQRGIIKSYPVNQTLSQLKNQVLKLRSQGESEEYIHQLRVDKLGERDALDILDHEQYMESWAARYKKYSTEKQLILNSGLDQTEKNKQVEYLLKQHYQDNELASIRALDRL